MDQGALLNGSEPHKEVVKEVRELRKGVLVVEDDPLVVDIVQDVLMPRGYTVFVAGSAEEALKLFGEHHHNVLCVILDYGIPDMHAARLLNCLREVDKEVRVLLSSGYPQSFISLDFPVGLVDGFVAKPYEPEVLVSELRRFH